MTVKDSFFLPIEPFPAERTQCACRGKGGRAFPTVYNKAKYKEWLEEAVELLHGAASQDLSEVRESPVTIHVEAIRARPKSTKLYAPLGDNDNVEKGLWDAITKAGHWWKDDRQIIMNKTEKRWAKPGEAPGFYVTMEFLGGIKYSG